MGRAPEMTGHAVQSYGEESGRLLEDGCVSSWLRG